MVTGHAEQDSEALADALAGAEMNEVVGGNIKQQLLNRVRLWWDVTLGVGFGC